MKARQATDRGLRGERSGIVKIRDDFVERTGTYLQRIPDRPARRPKLH